jgi:hypothetical protein
VSNGEFRDDAGFNVDASCKRSNRQSFVVTVHALQVFLG